MRIHSRATIRARACPRLRLLCYFNFPDMNSAIGAAPKCAQAMQRGARFARFSFQQPAIPGRSIHFYAGARCLGPGGSLCPGCEPDETGNPSQLSRHRTAALSLRASRRVFSPVFLRHGPGGNAFQPRAAQLGLPRCQGHHEHATLRIHQQRPCTRRLPLRKRRLSAAAGGNFRRSSPGNRTRLP